MFSSKSFSTVSFSPKSFFFGIQESASSGMRRLQMYQMQEEALKKEEQKTVKAAVKEAIKEKEAPVQVKKVRKPVKKRVIREEPLPVIPFKRIPVAVNDTVFDELAKLPPIVFEVYVQQLSATIISFQAEKQKRSKRRRKIAALLLLAA